MHDGGGNGTGSFVIEVWSDAATYSRKRNASEIGNNEKVTN